MFAKDVAYRRLCFSYKGHTKMKPRIYIENVTVAALANEETGYRDQSTKPISLGDSERSGYRSCAA